MAPNTSEIPPPVAMMSLITGYWVSQAVGVVATLGVADQLRAGPLSADDIALKVGADPQALYHLLKLLASMGSSPRRNRARSASRS